MRPKPEKPPASLLLAIALESASIRSIVSSTSGVALYYQNQCLFVTQTNAVPTKKYWGMPETHLAQYYRWSYLTGDYKFELEISDGIRNDLLNCLQNWIAEPC